MVTVDESLDALADGGIDLVISRWGHGRGPGGMSDAEHLLSEIRRRDLRAPVIIFASGAHAAENKLEAMGLGARSYTSKWDELFAEIERVLDPGST